MPFPRPFVRMSRTTYSIIKDEATKSKRENVGAVFGRREGGNFVINRIERFPQEIAGPPQKLSLKHRLTGATGDVASPRVDLYVGQRPGVVGIYHSHPSGEPFLGPGDKKEFRKMAEFKHLRGPSELQVIARMKGLGLLGRKGEPLFFVKCADGKYRRANVVVK
jgi:proteasome lid subunit RPN8/RPN11